MKNFKSLLKLQLIIFSLNFLSIVSYPISKNNKKLNLIKTNTSHTSQKKLSNEICNIKNCLVCENRNECIKCNEGFELDKKRCYSKNCHIYGFCKFCDEYDCLKCMKGYKLNYGICDQMEVSRKKLYFLIFIFILLIIFIIYICIRYKNIAKLKIATGQVIKFIHPKSGFYQLHYESTNENPDNSKQVISFNSSDNKLEKIQTLPPVVDRCVICEVKNVYAIADCGCSICLLHYKLIKRNQNIKCKIHNVTISSNISFKMAERSKIQGNAVEKLGLQKCPICKINSGTQSFNCGCKMKVCEKCFNDNVYVFKYNQCPGCGQKYNPIKMTVRWNKNSSEHGLNFEKNEENGAAENGKQ